MEVLVGNKLEEMKLRSIIVPIGGQNIVGISPILGHETFVRILTGRSAEFTGKQSRAL